MKTTLFIAYNMNGIALDNRFDSGTAKSFTDFHY